jgi:hypothetical protein
MLNLTIALYSTMNFFTRYLFEICICVILIVYMLISIFMSCVIVKH